MADPPRIRPYSNSEASRVVVVVVIGLQGCDGCGYCCCYRKEWRKHAERAARAPALGHSHCRLRAHPLRAPAATRHFSHHRWCSRDRPFRWPFFAFQVVSALFFFSFIVLFWSFCFNCMIELLPRRPKQGAWRCTWMKKIDKPKEDELES